MQSYKYFLALFFLMCFGATGLLSAQNEIQNGGFEEVSKVPCIMSQNGSEFKYVKPWYSPASNSSPDLYSTLGKDKCPAYFFSNINSVKPHGGDNMAYLLVNAYDYVAIKLKNPLRKGNTYLLEFWVANEAKASTGVMNNVGALLTTQAIQIQAKTGQKNEEATIKGRPQVNESAMIEGTEWKKVSGTFVADSAYQYLHIGCFFDKAQTQVKALDGASKFPRCYYYIDDVALYPSNGSPDVEDKITINSLAFEPGSSELSSTNNFKYLDSLATVFRGKKTSFKILGHTDKTGEEKTNIKLSLTRAESVKAYFVSKGIDPSRIATEGKGSSEPVGDNNTESGKKQNRRVELIILKSKE
ncbi:MAG: hypothetical protein EAZ57_04670 [Cytophagales bacterium]|nr:MAG: hypothetical protein EAZ67_01210 [Cytophagales bacterium]TAF61087.1 MAG: hypothetical protein EAZ57_04670 [Cytophagales bacterium]